MSFFSILQTVSIYYQITPMLLACNVVLMVVCTIIKKKIILSTKTP